MMCFLGEESIKDFQEDSHLVSWFFENLFFERNSIGHQSEELFDVCGGH